MKKIRLTFFSASLTALTFVSLAFQLKHPPLPKPFDTPSVNNRPQVISRPEGAELKLPKGFNIHVYAQGFERPRFMAEGPSKEILISDSVKDGAVYVLLDKDKDFKADSKQKLIDGLDRPYGLAFWKDYLYIAETTSLKRYKYDAKTMTLASPGEEVVSMKDFGQGHWTRTVLFDREGRKMYLTTGSRSNVSTGEDPRRAAINRYNPDGTEHEIVASGVRNVIGLRWYPGTETLWAAVQERDRLGDDLVPDYFTAIKEGGFYGWPYAYIGPNEDPRNEGLRPDLVKKSIVPDVLLGAHVAVLDAIFYTGEQFPQEYQGGAFLAFHGSWNRSERIGYSVTFIPFREGKPVTGPQDFLTGFMLDPDKREVWGRPVGLFQMQDGSLLVSEDGGNKVWRIFYE
ncbi:MAG: PQQ-dependent sugar dehydrogenase [Acidobacteriota bacterium]